MHTRFPVRQCMMMAVCLAVPARGGALDQRPSIVPSRLPPIGTIDTRFQSYNIEMVEITGGWFWKPYASGAGMPPPAATELSSERSSADRFQVRPPIDLRSPRLRKLAAALAPAYLRVSGTWANSTAFVDQDEASSPPPTGFKGLLTRPQWQGVVDFSRAVDAPIVTSFAISAGSRDAAGVWTPNGARRLLDYTHSIGGHIAAAEFMNEPDLPGIGGAPHGYDSTKYGVDFRIFLGMVKQTSPELLVLGPGTASPTSFAAELLTASGPGLDVISFHHYGGLSKRCGPGIKPELALSEAWLSSSERALDRYKTLRDEVAPGKPIWLTETAQAACGGDPWAASFLDTFRYLDQLGQLAKAGVRVVFHNTLAASDYGLLDEATLQPRPNYWGALLWRQLMGPRVLDAGVSRTSGLHVYAHCLPGTPGGVTLLVINPDRYSPHVLMLTAATQRYTLDAADLLDQDVRLNGTRLELGPDDELPRFAVTATDPGELTFQQATITFLAIAHAENDSCR